MKGYGEGLNGDGKGGRAIGRRSIEMVKRLKTMGRR